MKLLLFAVATTWVFSFYSCADSPASDNKVKTGGIKPDSLVFHDTLYHDTFFIYRYLDSESYTGFYLCKDKEKAGEYKRLMNFKLDTDDYKNLAEDCKYATDSVRVSIKKFDLPALAYDWISLVQYKKKQYWYGGRVSKVLTDSILIFDTQDGFHSVALQSVTMPKPNEYTIHYKGSIMGEKKNNSEGFINIYILDPKSKLTAWEIIENGIHDYELRIPKENAKNYALIKVNSTEEPDEHIFEKIDFKKLIRESQGKKE